MISCFLCPNYHIEEIFIVLNPNSGSDLWLLFLSCKWPHIGRVGKTPFDEVSAESGSSASWANA